MAGWLDVIDGQRRESMILDLQIIGLIYDAAGITILGIPAAFRMVDEVKAQSGTYWNWNPPMARALSYARIDTTIGSCLLLFGFGFQISALTGYKSAHYVASALLLALIVFFLLYWALLRAYWSNCLIAHVERQRQREADTQERT